MTLRRSAADTVPVAAPPRVAAQVAAAPDGPVRVLHTGRDMVHLEVAGRAVGVAAAGAPGLPHALRTDLAMSSFRGSSAEGPTAYVESGLLHLGGRALVVGRLVDVRAPCPDTARMPRTSPDAGQGTPRSRSAGLVPRSSTIELSRIDLGPIDLMPIDLGPIDLMPIDPGPIDPGPIDPGRVAELVGRGDGLTPLGDDVLCGWLAAHRAAGVETPAVDDAVRRALPRTTTLSATLLECALEGEAADLAAGYLRALGTPAEVAARAALTHLGHTSGEGLAHGIDLAVAAIARAVAA